MFLRSEPLLFCVGGGRGQSPQRELSAYRELFVFSFNSLQ